MIVFILTSSVNYFFRTSKGNISKYNIEKFSLIWKDNLSKIKKGKLKNPNINLKIYKEGIRYLNYFIEWKKIKQINYPKTFRTSKKVGKFAYLILALENFLFSLNN